MPLAKLPDEVPTTACIWVRIVSNGCITANERGSARLPAMKSTWKGKGSAVERRVPPLKPPDTSVNEPGVTPAAGTLGVLDSPLARCISSLRASTARVSEATVEVSWRTVASSCSVDEGSAMIDSRWPTQPVGGRNECFEEGVDLGPRQPVNYLELRQKVHCRGKMMM
mmetsp:Transcript_37993/g.95191  ORF Transcript_37993/g.95191 Transcript_37993/m.95191 type:complete len:168 (+) Transcript_37993:735-1238(+)